MRLLVITLATLSVVAVDETVGKKCSLNDRTFRNIDNLPQEVIIYTQTGMAVCDPHVCIEITYNNVNTTYGTLFVTSPRGDIPYVGKECLESTNEESRPKRRVTCNIPTNDGDICCITQRHGVKYYGTYSNTDSETVQVVCLSLLDNGQCDRYQFVTVGECIPDSRCGYNDTPCIQEYTVHSLLAYKPGAPYPYLSFELIYIPTYCSCKNIRR